MASFVTMNLNSDDESDDGDFVPEGIKYSDDSGSDIEETKSNKLKKSKKIEGRKGGIFLGDIQDEDNADSRKDEFEQEKIERKKLENEKKVDDLWASFKTDTSAKTNKSSQTKPKQASGGLGSFSSMNNPKKKKSKIVSVKKVPKKDIMSSIFGDLSKTADENTENKTSNSVSEMSNPEENVPKSIISSIFESTDHESKERGISSNQAEDEESQKFNGEVFSSSNSGDKTIKITKTYDFAGESIEVTKEVDKNSKEGKKFLKVEDQSDINESESKSKVPKRTAMGLSSVMGVISGKKPKLGVLDKSKMDWNKFTAEEGIKEQLETYNKGKEGYVEKQMFLERADYRRFEIEKEAREKSRKPLNK